MKQIFETCHSKWITKVDPSVFLRLVNSVAVWEKSDLAERRVVWMVKVIRFS
jgi:hypothetical protein